MDCERCGVFLGQVLPFEINFHPREPDGQVGQCNFRVCGKCHADFLDNMRSEVARTQRLKTTAFNMGQRMREIEIKCNYCQRTMAKLAPTEEGQIHLHFKSVTGVGRG